MRIKCSCLIILIAYTMLVMGCGEDHVELGMEAEMIRKILGTPLEITDYGDLGILYSYEKHSVWIDPITRRVTSVSNQGLLGSSDDD